MGLFTRRPDARTPVPAATASPWFTSRPETEAVRYGGPPESSLPVNIVSMMDQFGRFEFDPMGAGVVDASGVWQNLVVPLLPYAQADPAGFLRDLADAVVPAGGWAAYGGERLVKELLSGDLEDPSYDRIMTVALHFLRACGVPSLRLNGYESSFWARTTGRTEPWLYSRQMPTAEQAALTELQPGEVRCIAQLEAAPDSNAVFVCREDDGSYTALIDARYSDTDPSRGQTRWKSAASLHDLYLEVGRALQVPSHWYDAEFEPYFPYPKPKIDWLPGPAPSP